MAMIKIRIILIGICSLIFILFLVRTAFYLARTDDSFQRSSLEAGFTAYKGRPVSELLRTHGRPVFTIKKQDLKKNVIFGVTLDLQSKDFDSIIAYIRGQLVVISYVKDNTISEIEIRGT